MKGEVSLYSWSPVLGTSLDSTASLPTYKQKHIFICSQTQSCWTEDELYSDPFPNSECSMAEHFLLK